MWKYSAYNEMKLLSKVLSLTRSLIRPNCHYSLEILGNIPENETTILPDLGGFYEGIKDLSDLNLLIGAVFPKN